MHQAHVHTPLTASPPQLIVYTCADDGGVLPAAQTWKADVAGREPAPRFELL